MFETSWLSALYHRLICKWGLNSWRFCKIKVLLNKEQILFKLDCHGRVEFIMYERKFTYFYVVLTYSMKRNPSWEANRFSTSQEIPRISWSPKVHYRIHKCPPFFSYPETARSRHTHTTHFLKAILILSSPLLLGLPSVPGLFPSSFSIKNLYTPLYIPIRATWPAYLILLDFISRTVFDDERRPLSSTLLNFVHSPVTSSLLGPNILPKTLFSNSLSLPSTLRVRDQLL